MPSDNFIIVASAGSGKTTTIIDEACGDEMLRSAAITYTRNSTSEIADKIYQRTGYIPPCVTVSTWFSFLLRHFVRPYQNYLYPHRVSQLHFVNGISDPYSKATDIERHYFSGLGRIYSDKVTKFACQIIDRTKGLPLQRFEQIYDRLFVDECQDLQGYDLDLIEHIMRSKAQVFLVGDHRQATFSTNKSRRNKQFAGPKIIDKFMEWEKSGLCALDFQTHSHRCVQTICDFADQFFPGLPKTISRNTEETGHDGVFAISGGSVNAYMTAFNPQPLRYDRTTKVVPERSINFGGAKGMTFERTIIFPHGPLKKFLQTGKLADAGKSIEKIYVAITRAKQSVAFVVDDGSPLASLPLYKI